MKTSWSVMVVYENEAKRGEAAKFCHQLVERFWAGADLDLSWWAFEQLRKQNSIEEAVEKAAEADVVVIALRPKTNIPLEVDFWLENWLACRGDREGMLVGLLGPEENPEVPEKHLRLRKVARRAGMDYLTQLPDFAADRIPESFEPYHDRVHRMTSVMDDILHRSTTPHLPV